MLHLLDFISNLTSSTETAFQHDLTYGGLFILISQIQKNPHYFLHYHKQTE